MTPSTDEPLELVHPTGRTRLYVGRDALGRARADLGEWLGSRQVFLVTSAEVLRHTSRTRELIEALAEEVVTLEIPDGEAAKSLQVARSLWTAMLDAGGRRDSRLVALGGGSIGDVGGFVASTFLRGIGYANLPTTLLAQVDAAIGGKTAIDLPAAKNSVGSFWHPDWVVADVDLLRTLPARELRAGMTEVVKIAAGCDAALFERLEQAMPTVPGIESDELEAIVRQAVEAKIGVVEADPAEGDGRRVLNLGHTLGHAIEAALGFEQLRHGEAVAYGLLFAQRLARRRGADRQAAARLIGLLERLDPPDLPELSARELIERMRHDKKARREGLVWVLPMAVGEVEIRDDIEPSEVAAELERFLEDPWVLG